MKTAIITIITIFVFISESFSSVGQVWANRYNGSGNSLDVSNAIAMDQTGNIYVTGYSTGITTSKDYKTIKYSPNGVLLWEASFSGPINGGDYSYALALDASGNVYVTGRVDYGAPTNTDIVTIKYNSLGVQQWFARYNGTYGIFEEGKVIQVDNSGNVYVGGRCLNSTSTSDFITIKYAPDGTQSWVAIYNGPGNNEDYITSLVLDNSGNVYIAGGSIGSNTGSDFVTIKYNTAGVQQWVKRYNSPTNGGDAAVGVKVDSQGNIITGGFTDMGPSESYNFLTIKYDANGTIIWEKQYNGSSSTLDLATCMTIDAADNIYLTGLTTNNTPFGLDSNYVTIKYNSSGQLQWASFYNGPNNSVDISRSISVDNSLNVYISGSSKGIGSDDFVTIKYLPNGTASWILSYNGPGNGDDNSTSVVSDNLGNAFVTGRSMGSGTSYDYATIKYGDLVGINPISSQVPDKFSLYQNYPNPFNPSTKIKFDLPEESKVVLKIFNTLGAEVYSENMGSLLPATYEYVYNTSGLPSGIYFYSLQTNRLTETKKMILVK
ncbi:MAG: SBBP repeat-containing protein [Ignavibacteria bacterium]